MSLAVHPYDEPLPSTLIASRDVVSEVGAALHSTGPSNAPIAQQAPPTSAPNLTALGTKKRKAFKVTKPLSRSLSTPHIRGVIMSDADEDKKRNKLGYQRISIACAHCRRRKIRCLIAEGDPHGRCQNCIRLKKDCAFYPVDQQGIVDTKSQPSSSGAASVPSTSSKPSSSTPPDFDPTRRDQSMLPPVPSNAPDYTGMGGVQIHQGTPFSGPIDTSQPPRPDERVFNEPPTYLSRTGPGLQQQPDYQQSWIGAGSYHDPASGAPHSSHNYHSHPQSWRQPSLPTPGDYSSSFHYESSASTASQRANQYAFQQPTWPSHPPHPAQARSMSYGQIETYPHHMDSFPTLPHQLHAPGMMRMPQPLEVSGASMMGPGPQSAPLRPDYQSYLNHQSPYMMQQGEFAQKPAIPSSDPNYPGFYQESPPLGSVHGSHSPMHDPNSYANASQPG